MTDGFEVMVEINTSGNVTSIAEKTRTKKRQPEQKAEANDVGGADGVNAAANTGVVAKRTRIKGKLSPMMAMLVDIFTEIGSQLGTANVVVW